MLVMQDMFCIFSSSVLLQASELLTSLTVTLDLLGSKLVRFTTTENDTILVNADGIGL